MLDQTRATDSSKFDGFEIGFNGKFILDFLGTLSDGDFVRIAMAGPGEPAIFTAVGDETMLCVIMPMRV